MGRYTGKACRLLTMLAMTASFFLVEIVVGYITNSIALVADSFHMLSDVVALVVGFASVRISKWHTRKNTFGWQRAEVLGAMVNAVFLIALCFSILVESLKRIVEVEKINNPQLMLIVGAAGLVVNLIGLALFHNHGHSHGGGGGHGHSHGGKKPKKGKKEGESLFEKTELSENALAIQSEDECDDEKIANGSTTADKDKKKKKKMNSSAQLNMRGVFLHVLGDALGSVIVIISALIVWFVDEKHTWVSYVDPVMSIILVFIILSTTLPLLKESGLILLQTVPTHIQIDEVQEKVEQIDGVLAVHEFHVWQLAGNRIIASAHVRCRNMTEYMRVAGDVKNLFHEEGIHSTTIQPEFIEFEELSNDRDCILECGPDKKCFSDTCCGTVEKKPSRHGSPERPPTDAASKPLQTPDKTETEDV